MQIPIRLWTALALAGVILAGQVHAQSGFDRRGGDYLRFEIRSGDPAVCAARCERDARWGALLSQGQHHAATAQTMLHFRRGPIALSAPR